MKRVTVPLTAALVTLLPGCGPQIPVTNVDFATQPSVLRGTLTGAARLSSTGTSFPVRLETQATYRNEYNYDITGTLTVGAGPTQPVQGEGYTGGYNRYIRPQLSVAPPGSRLTAKGADGLNSWKLSGSFISGPDTFSGSLRDLTAPINNPREYTLTISRAS